MEVCLNLKGHVLREELEVVGWDPKDVPEHFREVFLKAPRVQQELVLIGLLLQRVHLANLLPSERATAFATLVYAARNGIVGKPPAALLAPGPAAVPSASAGPASAGREPMAVLGPADMPSSVGRGPVAGPVSEAGPASVGQGPTTAPEPVAVPFAAAEPLLVAGPSLGPRSSVAAAVQCEEEPRGSCGGGCSASQNLSELPAQEQLERLFGCDPSSRRAVHSSHLANQVVDSLPFQVLHLLCSASVLPRSL